MIAKFASGLTINPLAAKSGSTTTSTEDNDPGPSVVTLCQAFKSHAERHYVKNGKQTSEVHIVRSIIKPLRELYGFMPAKDFGPLALKAVRARMVELGWARNTVNAAMSRIRRIFKYAVENEMIDVAVLHRLQTVAPLLAGRTEARDNAPRQSVKKEHIDAVCKIVSPAVKDLIELQRLTGARSGELLTLTTGMIDQSENVWLARLTEHKTEHHGMVRILSFGPKAQIVLKKYLSDDSEKPIFKITRAAYCRAITRACKKAKIARWVPHQLRHAAADVIRQMFGLEYAQSVLGHAKADMSEHYAKAGISKAVEVALKIG